MYIRRCGRGSEESSASMIMCTFLFGGGKDSGVLLNACVEHIRQYGGRMGVFHMDYEFQECFSFWLRKQLGVQKVACLVGIRTQESFNR